MLFTLKMICELNVEQHFLLFCQNELMFFAESCFVVGVWELSLSLSTHLVGHGTFTLSLYSW
jgi:hypothetical protein